MMNKKNTQKNDYALAGPPSDSVSCLACSSDGTMLVASSWDNSVRCWSLQQQQPAPHSSINHEAPVLCCDVASDNTTVFSAGCDNQVKMWNVAAGTNTQQIGQHQAPVRCLKFSTNHNVVVTGAWDRTVMCWDTRSPQPAGTFQVAERVYAMDVKGDACVVSTAARDICVFDMRSGNMVNRMESPMKHQTRSLSIFQDTGGFVMGSIEGRVAVETFADKKSSFVFKCHRYPDARKVNDVYAVNDICFNTRGTFATVGSDGCFAFWDKDVRHRLSIHEQFRGQTLTCGVFHPSDTVFFYALSYDWSRGADGCPQNLQPAIMMHPVPPTEITHTKK